MLYDTWIFKYLFRQMRLYPFPVVRSGISENCVLRVYIDARDTVTLHYTIRALDVLKMLETAFLSGGDTLGYHGTIR